jgi:multiple sugar transport system substrate-binding protein
MPNIDFLTVILDQNTIPQIHDLFGRYQQKTGVGIDPSFVDWDTIWRELVNIGIYRRGSDVAEVGTTWLDSLVAMNALRPFSSLEVARMGGEEAYIPATWSTTSLGGDARVWGIPIRCDVRVIWYWKDMLEDVGVDPDTAFASIKSTQETLEKLKSVVDTPWGVATAASDPNIIQALASWLWDFGGKFVTPNCDKVLLMEPKALKALRAYFSLYPYVPQGTLGFSQRNVAAIVAGPWMIRDFANREISGEDMARVGIATLPGPPFIGGTVLSVWQHTMQSGHLDEALEFVAFMTQPEVQVEFAPHLGLLPTRKEAWEMPAMTETPYNNVIFQALSNGRTLPSVPLWGMVEEKLKGCFALIWEDLLTNPDADVDRAIERYLKPTVTRLNKSLK